MGPACFRHPGPGTLFSAPDVFGAAGGGTPDIDAALVMEWKRENVGEQSVTKLCETFYSIEPNIPYCVGLRRNFTIRVHFSPSSPFSPNNVQWLHVYTSHIECIMYHTRNFTNNISILYNLLKSLLCIPEDSLNPTWTNNVQVVDKKWKQLGT